MNHEDEDLARSIDAAFRNAPVPDANRLVRSVGIEGERVREFFGGKHWQAITLDALQNDYPSDGAACLWFMTPEAVAYYLPAYLRIAAFQFEAADSIAAELITKLLRVASGEQSSIAEAIALLGPPHHRVIARVLLKVAMEWEAGSPITDATDALNLRWRSYLS